MKMIAVGDNVTDCYIDQQVYYPGGNAVNVAVNCKRDGFDEAAYIGVFGDDENAVHLKWALTQEQVSFERSRTIAAPSGQPGVLLQEGDRVFVHGPQDTAQHIVRLRLTPEDLAYIGTFDVCHTSCFSGIEQELPALQKTCRLSFDFSERMDDAYLKQVCPYLFYAFFSGSTLSPTQIDALIARCHELGTAIVGITLGRRGALFSYNGTRFVQGITETKATDTMGAGDSFIAGFLSAFTRGEPMEQALAYAARCAAFTCTQSGGFGYPHPFSQALLERYADKIHG